MTSPRVPRPVVVHGPPKRRPEDGLRLTELIVLRALDEGATQAAVARSRNYTYSGIAAMLSGVCAHVTGQRPHRACCAIR